MRSMLLTGCLWMLSVATYAQNIDRVPSGTPLRWGMNGSIEIMDDGLAPYYSRAGNPANITPVPFNSNLNTATTALGGNPYNTRFASVQAQCANNSVVLNWVAVQRYNANFYEIEQSEDGGRTWKEVGEVPANRTDFGEAAYSFTYFKDARNVLFRVAAVSNGNERLFSPAFESPCSLTAGVSVIPNPVYSSAIVRLGSNTTARVKLLLLDSKGVVVQSRDAGLQRGMNDLTVDMSDLPSGYYTLAIRWANGKQIVRQVVKQ